MRLHLVGGFLGSGKTTAIIGAAKHLMAGGLRVGVVTNDQGKYLVDTAFVRLMSIPATEVTGGCFCCNYDDLQNRLRQLEISARPDVVFAESVGSCADLVATVVRPFLELPASAAQIASLSVFTDIRLLERRLNDLPLLFSDDVVYIFDQQIEEAGLLVINKADRVSPEAGQSVLRQAQARDPNKTIRLQNSLDPADVGAWVERIEAGSLPLPRESLDIDYQRYGAGEAQLGWLNQQVTFAVEPGKGRAVALAFIGALVDAVRRQGSQVGHIKFLLTDGQTEAKISFTALEDPRWPAGVPELEGERLSVLVNARVEMDAAALHSQVLDAISASQAQTGARGRVEQAEYFQPAFPRPTYRLM